MCAHAVATGARTIMYRVPAALASLGGNGGEGAEVEEADGGAGDNDGGGSDRGNDDLIG